MATKIPVVTESGTLFYRVIRDTSERVAEMGRHLQLERVLSELTAKFINLPASQVDQEITSGLEVLAEALDNDRAHLGQVDPASGDNVITHAWCRPGFTARAPDSGGLFPLA